MAEQQLRRQVRRRKVGAVRSVVQTESLLSDALNESASIMGQIEDLQDRLATEQGNATQYMEELKIGKFLSIRAEATYDHPAQKTTNTFDASGLFEDVAVEDFLSSVKVQKGLAEKCIDPKILKRTTTSTKSELKPKTIKIKLRK